MSLPALHGRREVVGSLLSVPGVGVERQDSCGLTPFMDAIKAGHTDIARMLLEYKVGKCEYLKNYSKISYSGRP